MDTSEKELKGRKILIVDDEPDVLETLEELLSMCEIVKASTFEEGKKQLESQIYDFAILDIMGVNGYALLEIATERNHRGQNVTALCPQPGGYGKILRGRGGILRTQR